LEEREDRAKTASRPKLSFVSGDAIKRNTRGSVSHLKAFSYPLEFLTWLMISLNGPDSSHADTG
jgi:hypothetical protein